MNFPQIPDENQLGKIEGTYGADHSGTDRGKVVTDHRRPKHRDRAGVSIREYAVHAGLSRGAVEKALATGRGRATCRWFN
jgi:hypothetical protein